jgi:hypothetical protein
VGVYIHLDITSAVAAKAFWLIGVADQAATCGGDGAAKTLERPRGRGYNRPTPPSFTRFCFKRGFPGMAPQQFIAKCFLVHQSMYDRRHRLQSLR